MDIARLVVSVVAACIAALTLATGPVGLLEIPESSGVLVNDPGTGNASVDVVSEPETVTVRESQQDVWVLEVPSTTVEVSNIQENPLLDYSVSVSGTGYSVSSATPLGSPGPGRIEVGVASGRLDAESARNATGARLQLVLRGDTDRTLLERDVEVRG
jgi:hypothetical protein